MPGSLSDTIRQRRTVHHFRPGDLPPKEVLLTALEQAVWVPNHHLTQPWRFHLLGPQTAEQICSLNAELVRDKKGDKAAAVKLRRWREVPGWLLLSRRRVDDELRDREDYAACCCVAHNLSLLLWEKGIGMKWTTGAVTRHSRFFDIVQLDSDRDEIVGLFWYGYPAEIPAATRLPAEEVTSILP